MSNFRNFAQWSNSLLSKTILWGNQVKSSHKPSCKPLKTNSKMIISSRSNNWKKKTWRLGSKSWRFMISRKGSISWSKRKLIWTVSTRGMLCWKNSWNLMKKRTCKLPAKILIKRRKLSLWRLNWGICTRKLRKFMNRSWMRKLIWGSSSFLNSLKKLKNKFRLRPKEFNHPKSKETTPHPPQKCDHYQTRNIILNKRTIISNS